MCVCERPKMCTHRKYIFNTTSFFLPRYYFHLYFCYHHEMKRPKYTHHTTKELLPTPSRYSIVLQNAAMFFEVAQYKQKIVCQIVFKKMFLFDCICVRSYLVKINLLPISREIIPYYICIECMLYMCYKRVFSLSILFVQMAVSMWRIDGYIRV